SFSRSYFTRKFSQEGLRDCVYELHELSDVEDFRKVAFDGKNRAGFNVTIPYKTSIIPYLDELDPVAAEVGAVNCIRIQEGRLIGYNTDVIGFETTLKKLIGGERPRCFVLGSGGAAKAVRYVLHEGRYEYFIVSRKPTDNQISYENIPYLLASQNLFINTTPLGMYPDVDSFPPIPYLSLTANDFMFDLIYNPPETVFLQKGKERGCKIINGMMMLEIQAEESWKIWNM
ncbi:MAG: shikimate dehydrogenase, partial [Chitinophagales bacterium]|nr:shikimate dehydrogenase [Chitinophagales bacterium]